MKHFPTILLTLTAIACSSGNYHKSQITDYELQAHQIIVDKIDSIASETPFTAADSLALCELELKHTKAALTAIQQSNIDTLLVKIAKSKDDMQKTQSEAMRNMIQKGIKSMEYKCELSRKIIDMYEYHPEETSLNKIVSKANIYKADPDSVLAHTIRCTFTGRQGQLPAEKFTRLYIITDGKIIGEITAP